MTRRRRPRTSEERLISAVGSVVHGAVGGRVRNVRQAAALERNTGPSASSGGFDPNADPVVIGSGAAASGAAGAVSIGRNANGGPDSTVAIGDGANAQNNGDIAIGPDSFTGASGGASFYSIAIGKNTQSLANDTIAIGRFSDVEADNAIGIGRHTSALHLNSAAIGYNAATTDVNQIMLGSGHDLAMNGQWGFTTRDVTTGARVRVYVDSGVLTVV